MPEVGPRSLDSLGISSTDEQLQACVEEIKVAYPCDEKVAVRLARILAASGLSISYDDELCADVASTGGPSSLSTLLCPLFLRSGGVVVPKLGVPGRPAGGIDCLAQIKGYKTTLDAEDVIRVLRSGGYAHFVADGQLAPLDGRLFRIRQSSNAQSVPTLVVASLLSKKLAVGVRRAGLDVRVAPHGNFGESWGVARSNATLFLRAAEQLGIRAFPVLTDGRYPYQPYLGRRECLVALADIFADRCDDWLRTHLDMCRTLATICVVDTSRTAIANAAPGTLLKHFLHNVEDQGGTAAAFNRIVATTRSEHMTTLAATGHVGRCWRTSCYPASRTCAPGRSNRSSRRAALHAGGCTFRTRNGIDP
jgi:thymidine phosphorylase